MRWLSLLKFDKCPQKDIKYTHRHTQKHTHTQVGHQKHYMQIHTSDSNFLILLCPAQRAWTMPTFGFEGQPSECSTEAGNGAKKSDKASTLERMTLRDSTVNSGKKKSGFAHERVNLFIEGISIS